ncbi:DUF5615 family PIN-like protein [Leptolyngbya sp. ST-U4]
MSRKLVTRLSDIFSDCSHVQLHKLAEQTDTQIWEFATQSRF